MLWMRYDEMDVVQTLGDGPHILSRRRELGVGSMHINATCCQEWDPATGQMVATTIEIETGDLPQAMTWGVDELWWQGYGTKKDEHKLHFYMILHISTCRYLGLLYWSLLCILYIVFNQRLICDFLLIALFWLPQRVRQRQPQFQHHVHLKRWRCGSAGQPNNPLTANCSRHFGITLVMLDNAWH